MSVVPTSDLVKPLNKRIMLVLPWYKSVSPLTSFCVMQLHDKRRTASLLNFGDAFVAHTRNKCAELFLESDCDWMLTIDDDMLVPFGNARWYNAHSGFNLPEPFCSFNAIDRLLSHNKTLVGGLYFGRWPNASPVYGEGKHTAEAEYANKAPIDICKPTRWVGTGCMLVHRSVYADISTTFPALQGNWFSSSEHAMMERLRQLQAMLSVGAMDGAKALRAYEMVEGAMADFRNNSTLAMGEDVAFCVRAKQAGHQPFVDMGLVCGHIGHRLYGPKQ